MNKICATCLSHNRLVTKLKSLNKKEIRNMNFKLNSKSLLCWECHTIFKRISTFRKQVVIAQNIFQSYSKKNPPTYDFTTLSKLSLYNKNSYDYVYIHNEIEQNDAMKNFEIESSISLEDSFKNDDDNYEVITKLNIKDEFVVANETELKSNIGKLSKHYVHYKTSEEKGRFIVKFISENEMLDIRKKDLTKKRYMNAPYKCQMCILAYFDELQYKRHIMEKHNEDAGFKCDVCQQRFASEAISKKHFDDHFKIYGCTLCNFTHKNVTNMHLHYAKDHEKERVYKCNMCDSKFESIRSLRYHKDTKHKELPTCEHCGKQFQAKSNLKMHILRHSSSPRVECQLCGKWYSAGSMRSHALTHRAPGSASAENAYCAECDRQFKYHRLYQQHLKLSAKHRSAEAVKYKCTECSWKFVNKSILTRHMNEVHLKKPQFSCDLCQKTFTRKDRLKQHVSFVHEGKNKCKDKICNFCGKAFNVLCALSFFATGSYQRMVGMVKYLGQTTVSKFVDEVTDALTHPDVVNGHIRFPTTVQERNQIRQKFYKKIGIPGVLGCVDGSHFHIFRPSNAVEHLYYCRKGFHSLNVQVVCDSDCKITSLNPKYGGATHDSFVWNNSLVRTFMESLHRRREQGWLLGDSGYPQRAWLMTPINDQAEGSPEAKYNNIHGKARILVENTFGRLKNRWRCLSKDRALHYSPEKCAKIITACAVLHNIAIDFQVTLPEEVETDPQIMVVAVAGSTLPNSRPRETSSDDLVQGRATRLAFVERLNLLQN